MADFIDNLGPFIKAGHIYEVINGCLDLSKGYQFKVLGKYESGLPYDNLFGWVITIPGSLIALDQNIYSDLYREPEKYLKDIGTFDLKAAMKRVVAEAPKTGFAQFMKKLDGDDTSR